MAINITTVYAGEVLEQLLVRATTGNELVNGGHIRVQPNVEKKFSIPRLRVGQMLQQRKEQPVQSDAKGNFNIDEKYLEPVDFMAFTTFNPRSFEQFWRKWQPTGPLVFRDLPAEAQNAFLTEIAKTVDFELGGHFITGVKGTTDDKLFNGILTRIVADTAVIKVGTPATPITEANVIAEMKKVRAAIPKAVRGQSNLKMFMSHEDADMYDYVLTEKPYKGADYTNMNPERFKGIPIVRLAGWPKNVIVAAVASAGLDSNFWAGVSYVNDDEVIMVDRLTNPGELYFFKMLMKVDTNIVFGEDIVLLDNRAAQ